MTYSAYVLLVRDCINVTVLRHVITARYLIYYYYNNKSINDATFSNEFVFRACLKCTKLQLKEISNVVITDMQFGQIFTRSLKIPVQKFKFSHELVRCVIRASSPPPPPPPPPPSNALFLNHFYASL